MGKRFGKIQIQERYRLKKFEGDKKTCHLVRKSNNYARNGI